MLTGENTYDGVTTVSAGTLRGNTASLPGDIVNNAILAFDQATDGDFVHNISGSGRLTKIGTGTLTLSGTNTYQGITSVQAGTLKTVSQTSLPTSEVSISSDATLELSAPSGDYAISNNISGAGALLKSGPDKIELTGTLTFTGPTRVEYGTLKAPLSELANSSAITIDSATDIDLSTSTGTIKADGPLTLGDPMSPSGYTFAGTLDVGSYVTYLWSADPVVLSPSTILNGGKLMAANVRVSGQQSLKSHVSPINPGLAARDPMIFSHARHLQRPGFPGTAVFWRNH